MLTFDDKQKIYRLLTENFSLNEEYSFEKIDALLNRNGYRTADCGYLKRRDMLEDLSEFIQLREIILGNNKHLAAVIRAWSEGGAPAVAASTEAPRGETVSAPQAHAAADEGSLTEADKREIYEVLTSVFPFEEERHMAAISKCLNDEGFNKERFGFLKMKSMLAQLPFLSMTEQIMNGVPQPVITLHRVPQWEEADTADNAQQNTGFALPDSLEQQIFLIPKTMAKLNQIVTGVEAAPSLHIRATLADDYAAAKCSGKLRRRKNAYTFPLSLKGLDGEDLIASIKPADRPGEYNWVLNFAGYAEQNVEPGRQLEQFAYCGPWASFLDELAEKALPEMWDFRGAKKSKFILFEYIKYTFYRLQLEDKICFSDDRSFAAFNTGLVTRHYDDIYACFEAIDDERYPTKWRFLEFCTAAARGLGKRLVDYFHPLPQPASYFTDKDDLFFDVRRDLHTDFQHIILDNISRLPIEFIREECRGSDDAQELIDALCAEQDFHAKKKLYKQLSDLLADTPRLYNRLRNRLEDSIELAIKRARWNFRTAIPCYTPKKNIMSLMLPLALQDDTKADAALIVEAMHSGNYQGQTILTMEQAYLDARLICRPESEWLDHMLVQESD